METCGAPCEFGSYTANLSADTVTGLTQSQLYWFNVIVERASGFVRRAR